MPGMEPTADDPGTSVGEVATTAGEGPTELVPPVLVGFEPDGAASWQEARPTAEQRRTIAAPAAPGNLAEPSSRRITRCSLRWGTWECHRRAGSSGRRHRRDRPSGWP